MSKTQLYQDLVAQLRSLLESESDPIANTANLAALLYHTLPELNWAGLYFLKGNNLVLGPFQGKWACTRIPLGKGVCGTAAVLRKTVIVPNVHAFPGHIACDSASKSEIAVPVIKEGHLFGVLDLDSPVLNRFDEEDLAGLELLVQVFVGMTDLGS